MALLPLQFVVAETSAIAEEQEYEMEVFTLTGLNILKGYEDGSYRLGEKLTRAEFAVFALRLLGFYEETTVAQSDIPDVEAGHWAAGYIKMAQGLNLMNGEPDGNFYPDNNVTRDEAAKILVCALGRDVQAAEGGYPHGYLAVANKVGIFNNLDLNEDVALTRGEAIRMIYNALDATIVTTLYGTDSYFNTDDTLMQITLARLNMYRLQGVIQGADETTIDGSELAPERVLVNGKIYVCKLDNLVDYIGIPVLFFAKKNADGFEEITSVIAETSRYKEITIPADDIFAINGTEIEYDTPDGRSKKIDVETRLNIIYNGYIANTLNLKDLNLVSGTVRFIDGDYNNIYETAIIKAEKAFTISSIDPDYRIVYLKDRLYMGKGFIRLDDMAVNMKYEILNPEGELVNIDALEEGMDISVAASTNFERVKVQILINNTITGELTEKGNDGDVAIDGQPYKLAEEANGIYSIATSDLKFGVTRTWHIDKDGKLFAVDDENKTNGAYAYVMDSAKQGTFSKSLKLKLLLGGSYVEIEDETSTAVELEDRMIYQLENKGIVTAETASKLVIDNYRYDNVDSALAALPAGTVICYYTDAEGKINKINTSVLWGDEYITERTYVKKHNLFESTGGGAFLIDKNTIILNLPKEDPDFGIYMTDSDCYVKTTLKDAGEYTAQGYDFDDDTKTVGVVVIQQDMSSETAAEITMTTPLALVTGITSRQNEEGDVVTILSGMRHGSAKEWECRGDLDLSNIKSGDIVRFTEDGIGRVARIQLVQRLEKGMTPYHIDAGGSSEEMFGYIKDVELKTFKVYSSTMENIVTLCLDGEGAGEYSFSTASIKSQPPVYVWDLDRKQGYIGSLSNCRSLDKSDVENASMALIYASTGSIQAIFIIN